MREIPDPLSVMNSPHPSLLSGRTPPWALRRAWRQADFRLQYYGLHPQEISQRLTTLERERDLAPWPLASAAFVALGLYLGGKHHSWWYALAGAAALQIAREQHLGPGPLSLLFRGLGVRDIPEIDGEMMALKALRGDYQSFGS